MEIACESERTFAQNGEEQGKKEEPKYVARREREKTELTLREYARAAMRCSYSWYQRTRLERRRAVIPLIRLNIYTRCMLVEIVRNLIIRRRLAFSFAFYMSRTAFVEIHAFSYAFTTSETI